MINVNKSVRIIVLLIAILFLILPFYVSSQPLVPRGPKVSKELPYPRDRRTLRPLRVREERVIRLEGSVMAITEKELVISSDNRTTSFLAKGRWLIVNENKIVNWSSVTEYVNLGDKVKIVALNRTKTPILIRLEKEDLVLIRPSLRKLTHILPLPLRSKVIDILGKVINSTNKGLIIMSRGLKINVLTIGKWFEVGKGRTNWRDVKDTFTPGDRIWIYGRLLPFIRKGEIKLGFIPKIIVDINKNVTILRL